MEKITRQEAKERKLPRYFSGIPCKRGHVCERYTSSGLCVECAKHHSRKHAEEGRRNAAPDNRLRKDIEESIIKRENTKLLKAWIKVHPNALSPFKNG